MFEQQNNEFAVKTKSNYITMMLDPGHSASTMPVHYTAN